MALQIARFCEKALVNFAFQGCRNTVPRLPVLTRILDLNARSVRTNLPRSVAVPKPAVEQEVLPDNYNKDKLIAKEIISKVNQQIKDDSHGRLFAVVQLMGKQFKVTNEDIVVVEGYWAPEPGDKIKMEKVLLVGGSDFTVVGRPIISSSLVNVEGTVIEKALSHTKTRFRKRRRKQFQRIKFYRSELTLVRINTVEFSGLLNEHREVEGTEGRVF